MAMITATATLSEQFRSGSAAEHRSAEASAFMSALVEGRVNAAGYAAYLGRLLPVYQRLESVGRELGTDEHVRALFDPALFRAEAIAADLAHWGGDAIDSPATRAYQARIEQTLADPVRYLGHHYTRYLGDLSGGQVVGRVLERVFQLSDGLGTAFYRFERIEKVKTYKDGYRARLDALSLSPEEQARVVEEVRVAFALNQQLFDELTAELPQYLTHTA